MFSVFCAFPVLCAAVATLESLNLEDAILPTFLRLSVILLTLRTTNQSRSQAGLCFSFVQKVSCVVAWVFGGYLFPEGFVVSFAVFCVGSFVVDYVFYEVLR